MFGPCTPYVTGDDVAASPDACGATDDQLDPYALEASEILYTLLGRQFPGVCTATVRPRYDDCCVAWPRMGMYVASCGLDAIPLHNPVIRILQVKIDGSIAVSGTDYGLRNGYELVRFGDTQWPHSQNMGLPDTDPDTFSVTYEYGSPPPHGVVSAATELTLELFKDAELDPAGKLPRATTGVSRQGMSLTIDRQVERVREAGPTLPRCSSALAAFNPSNQRIPPSVWSPDTGWVLDSFS